MTRAIVEGKQLPVSAIVLTFNEEANIAACLQTLAGWAGEIFVVDSGSADRTVEIARQFTENVVEHPFENYARQRNWAQEHLRLQYPWVFHVDADERVTAPLAAAIEGAFARDDLSGVSGLLVRRRIEFWGRHIRHGGIYPTYHCRLFRADCGRCEDREYDQHFVVEGATLQVEADLTEVTASSLPTWTARHNRWAQLEATHLLYREQAHAAGMVQGTVSGNPIEKRRWLRASVYERMPLFVRAFLYFFLRYVLRGGFQDGIPGLVYHVLHGFWFRFYVDACLWEMRHRSTG